MVISLDEIDKIRARLTYHREKIISMQIMHSAYGDTLASICAEQYLRLTSLEKDKASCFFSVFFGENLKFMQCFEDKIVVVFRKGIFEIGTAIGAEECQVVQNMDAVDHEGEIDSVDIEPRHRFIMTAGSDNRIKIWSTLKILIYEIKLDEGLKYAIWSNNLEIFVAHRNKLLYLRDFSFETEGIDDERTVEVKGDKRFVCISLRDCFDLIKKDQGIEVKKYVDIDQEYEEIVQKSRKKASSYGMSKSGVGQREE